MVLPVNGTREALFAFVQAAVGRRARAARGDAQPVLSDLRGRGAARRRAAAATSTPCAATGFLPDLDAVPAAAWQRCQVLFLCSPGNPTGAVLSLAYLQQALDLAERYDFIIASDECYADIYLDEAAPPPGLLEAALAGGRARFERCVVFHSLSKRSSVPGLRSGFVAGDPEIIERFLLYRTYHGSAMPVPTQLASIAAWEDDAHAAANRALYQEKFARVLPMLGAPLRLSRPAGAFYLWADVGGDDEHFTRELYATGERHGAARQLPRARRRAGQPGRRARAHLAHAAGRGLCRGRRPAPDFLRSGWEPCETSRHER